MESVETNYGRTATGWGSVKIKGMILNDGWEASNNVYTGVNTDDREMGGGE